MASTRTLRFTYEEWQKFRVRRDALREARRLARRKYCLVEIWVGHQFGKMSELRASVDGRYWLMDPKDFKWPEPPKAAAKSVGSRVKAPSFLFE